VHPIDIGKDEQFKPEFLKISPNDRIPAIVDRENGISLMESGAILIYLADNTGKLLPKSGEGHYRVLEWLMWQMGGPGSMFGQVHFVKYNKGKAPYAEERYLKEAHRLYSVLDRRLAEHEFADIAIWPWVSRYEWQTVDLNAYKPNFTTMGVGAMICQKFLDWHGSREGVDADNIEALLVTWAMGYMSALNLSKFASGQPRKDLNGWSHEQQRSALHKYCTKRSSAHVVDAVIALFTALPEYPEQTGE
jgi:GST-like protein